MPTAPNISTPADAEAFLRERANFERTVRIADLAPAYKLERMQTLCARLGHPEQRVPAVHIAGTKGKGSTATMLASILRSAGYRTGLYTSPHLCDVRERIAVDGACISPVDFATRLDQIAPTVRALDQEFAPLGPTYFEVLTAAALVHFEAVGVDLAVLEVGLGGRLDSTNVCHPICSVITNISLDHTRQLGRTLSAIAGEKAGIIKPQVPVVSGTRARTARDVIVTVAREAACDLIEIDRDFQFQSYLGGEPGNEEARWYMDFQGRDDWRISGLELPMPGRHQHANAALALATCSVLQRRGWSVDLETCRRGLTSACASARLEVVRRDPLLVIDTAHNQASMAATMQGLRDYWPRRHPVVVLATTQGKDIAAILQQILPTARVLVLTQYQTNPRSNPVDGMAAVAARIQERDGIGAACRVVSEPDPIAALRFACGEAAADDVICVTGSFYLAAEILPELGPGIPVTTAGLVAQSQLG